MMMMMMITITSIINIIFVQINDAAGVDRIKTTTRSITQINVKMCNQRIDYKLLSVIYKALTKRYLN